MLNSEWKICDDEDLSKTDSKNKSLAQHIC